MKPDYIISFDLGILNFSYCILSIDNVIYDWQNVKINNTSKETYDSTCSKLADKLMELDLLNKVITYKKEPVIDIVIELQPTKNKKTIIMSGQLHMFFTIMKKMMNYKCINNVLYYHAKNKLKYYKPRPEDEPMPESLEKVKKGYYKNKRLIIFHCDRILKHNNEKECYLKLYKGSKKKDDLADSYIQGLSYIQSLK